jgi:hypothetical protein
MGCSDSPPPVPPHFVSFAWRYPGRIRVSLPRPPDASATGLELVTRYLPPGSAEKVEGPPRFLENPKVNVPRSPTPAGSQAPGQLRRCDAAFRCVQNVGSREFLHFGAQSHGPFTGCLRFATPVTRTSRKTRFRLLAKLCRTGVATPQGSNEKFPRYNRFLFSQAFLAHERLKYSHA